MTMEIKNINKYFFSLLMLILALSCVAPKELVEKVKNKPVVLNCPDVSYMTIAPRLTLNNWLLDFNKMIKDIPKEVSRNQMALSSSDNIKQFYWCSPTARPFVQIDTNIALKSNKDIEGLWRIRCNRNIIYKDSISYKDSSFHRLNTSVTNNDDDIIVQFTKSKLKFYVKKKNSKNYKQQFSKHYKILNGRYLLIYDKLRVNSATSFVGITNDRFLIWNSYSVIMETYFNSFKRWETNTFQLIFEKIE